MDGAARIIATHSIETTVVVDETASSSSSSWWVLEIDYAVYWPNGNPMVNQRSLRKVHHACEQVLNITIQKSNLFWKELLLEDENGSLVADYRIIDTNQDDEGKTKNDLARNACMHSLCGVSDKIVLLVDFAFCIFYIYIYMF
jgi:hypothetical protein